MASKPVISAAASEPVGAAARPPILFGFDTEPDAIHPHVGWHWGAFCSRSCHDAYHD
jgi:hypothetical protein